MQIFKNKTNFDFMGKARTFAILSTVAVVVSLAATLLLKPKFGIDFVGGTEIQVKFKDSQATVGNIKSVLKKMGFTGMDVVSFGASETEYLIRLKEVSSIDDTKRSQLKSGFEKNLGKTKLNKFEFSPGGDKLTVNLAAELPIAEVESAAKSAGLDLTGEANDEDAEATEETARRCESSTCTWTFKDMFVYEISLTGVTEQVMSEFRKESWGEGAEKMRSEWVGAKVGEQLRNAGISSILYALVFIMVYIAFRFDLRFAPGAVIALLHDIFITLGIFTLLRIEVTLATVAALLTIVGYSLNDTIVVFDRIRENLAVSREVKLQAVVNRSLNETLSRTIMTSVTTLLAVLVLYTVGWKTSLRDFSFALVVGVIVGTYSSIYVATPAVVWFDRFFSKKEKA
ncbi:MAG: protein translocase subunit SecF [Deltaproteobacteria bacterium]|nr:protein translocase subunit SecF [Deltaproteobacteria bacterium]MBN2672778.1 protein translocase subunit SecF [Deltaproteobacteria bacterium]